LTHNLFLYVLNNVLRAKRYGAQTTRTGRVHNHVVAVALTDGEIFSNLLFTQRLYDALREKEAFHAPDPVGPEIALETAGQLVPDLLRQEGVSVDQLLVGEELEVLLGEMRTLSAVEEGIQELLSNAFDDSYAYHQAWVAKK
jgi:CRISPR-associated protein Csc2